MEKLFITIHNGETNEVETREMTEKELAEYKANQKAGLEFRAQQEKQNAARESALAKLAALGLTEDEIAAL